MSTRDRLREAEAIKGAPLSPQAKRMLEFGHMFLKFKHYEPILLSNFYILLKEVETTLTQSIRQILVSRGVEKSADLVKSVDVGYQQNFFQILANDYYQAVSKGRKPRARKVPVEDLIKWIKEKKIPYRGSINNAAFAIQQAIYVNGIAGKLYEESVIDFSSTVLSEITAEYIVAWGLWGVLTEIYHYENNEWVVIDTTFDSYKSVYEEMKKLAKKI